MGFKRYDTKLHMKPLQRYVLHVNKGVLKIRQEPRVLNPEYSYIIKGFVNQTHATMWLF